MKKTILMGVAFLSVMILSGCQSIKEQEELIQNLTNKNDELMLQVNAYENKIDEIEEENEHLSGELKGLQKLNKTLENTSYVEYYMSHKWSVYGGYYNYIDEDIPLIYPNESAPHVNEEVERWLEENPLVEVIMRTNNNFYLVRIPTIENYVYVNENNLGDLAENPEIKPVDISINGCHIGESVEKLKMSFNGKTTYGVENETKMVGFFSKNSDDVFDEKALAFVDEYGQIIGFRFSSEEFLLDGQYLIGATAEEVISHYDNKFSRDESYKNDGYEYTTERYVYIIGDYYLELMIDTEELINTSKIIGVNCQKKWW